MKKVIGISGSYRRNGIIVTLMDIMLNKIKENGIEVEKITLKDKYIRFIVQIAVNVHRKPEIREENALSKRIWSQS